MENDSAACRGHDVVDPTVARWAVLTNVFILLGILFWIQHKLVRLVDVKFASLKAATQTIRRHRGGKLVTLVLLAQYVLWDPTPWHYFTSGIVWHTASMLVLFGITVYITRRTSEDDRVDDEIAHAP